jgi:16S rRNA (guanine527-N7)-methyltransferase
VSEPALANRRASALTAQPERLLVTHLDRLGIASTSAQRHKLLIYARLVIAENERTNLTGAKDTLEFIDDHIIDSLRVLPLVELASPIVDVGSGAGLPGVPLAIMLAGKNFVLIEPRAKRAAFIELVKQDLELKNVTVVRSSALGPLARGWLGRAEWVMMRAVVSPERAFPLAAALLKPAGSLLLFAGRAQVTAATRKAARLAGFKDPQVRVPPESHRGRGHIWTMEKLH